MEPRLFGMREAAQPVLGRDDAGPENARPPYHVRTSDFMFVMAEFDRQAAQEALAPSLQLHPEQPGFFGLYSASSGWGLTPYSAFFAAVPVIGHDSPDGSAAYMMVEGFYSGRAARIMHDNYNNRLVPGFARQWREGDAMLGEAGPETTTVVSISITPMLPAPPTPLTAGVHHYIGQRSDGDLNIYSVAYSGEFFPAANVELQFNADASPMLQQLQPQSILFGSIIPAAPLTFSEPHALATSSSAISYESARMSLLDVMARLGRAAALVKSDGQVIFLNREAEELLTGAIQNGRLRSWRSSQQRELDRALAQVANGGIPVLAEPIAMTKPNWDRPILAQVIPIGRALSGDGAVMMLFSDPGGAASTDPLPALELLGLTRSEARIAAAVGEGRSPREVALLLTLSEHTVRSALKVIYAKLAISKQSELARIVARLDGFGAPLSRTALL